MQRDGMQTFGNGSAENSSGRECEPRSWLPALIGRNVRWCFYASGFVWMILGVIPGQIVASGVPLPAPVWKSAGSLSPASEDHAFELPTIGSNATWEETFRAEDRFPPPPRELARALTRGYEAYAAGEMVESLGWLERVINRDSAEDFLLRGPLSETGEETGVVSLSWVAHRLMCALPERQRELFRLKHAATAERLFQQATRDRDSRLLTEVMRRYLYTDAGIEAALVLGYEQYQQGRPGLAASTFRRLRMVPEARKQHDPNLGVMLAVCCSQSDQTQQALSVLESLQLSSGQSLTIAGKEWTWSGQQEPMDWLDQIGKVNDESTDQNSDWLMAGGSGHRLSSRGGGFPIQNCRWQLPLINDLAIEQAVLQELASNDSTGPGLQLITAPLVIDQTVVVRSFDRVMAIDLKSGKRIWYYPAIEELGTVYPGLATASERPTPTPAELASWLRRQAGGDDLASDGTHVFFVDRQDDTSNLASGVWINGGRSIASGSNRLVALDVSREGSLSWIAGGDQSVEPGLKEAFFLGPPLPLQDSVYSIVWLDGLVQLIQQDRNTGQLRWQQALGTLDSVVRLDDGSQQSLSPAYANGVLVCPTGLGVVVGIDLSTRNLLWGVDFQTTGNVRTFSGGSEPSHRWIGQAVQIAGTRVLITAQESHRVYCVDLLTGQTEWEDPDSQPLMDSDAPPRRRRIRSGRPRDGQPSLEGLPRDAYQMIAAATMDRVVMIGRNHIRSVRLEDGKVIWERVLPGQLEINGPGFFDQQRVWLPNVQGQIMAFAIEDGQQTGLLEMPWPIQTMISTDRDVIAVGRQHLGAFFRSQMAEDLFRQLDQQPNTQSWQNLPVRLVVFRGQLLRFQKQWEPAIQLFDTVYQREPTDYHREQLADTVLEALADGLAPVTPVLEKYGELLETRDRATYLRHLATGRLRQNDVAAAADVLLQMAELPTTLTTSETWLSLDQPEVRISWRQWIAWQWAQLEKVSESQQALLRNRLEKHAVGCLGDGNVASLINRLQVFGIDGLTTDQQLSLVRRLIDEGDLTIAQWLLTPILTGARASEASLLADQIRQQSGWRLPSSKGSWPETLPQQDFRFEITALSQAGTWTPVRRLHRDDRWDAQFQSRWRANDQLLEVYNGWGKRQSTTVLQDLVQRRLDPRLPVFQSDWGTLSLHHFGNELIQMDWTRVRSSSATPKLWCRDLANTDWSRLPDSRLGPIRSAVEFDEDKQSFQRNNGGSFGAISNPSPDAFLVHTGQHLRCVHPLNGELRWERQQPHGVESIWQTADQFLVLLAEGPVLVLDRDSGRLEDTFLPDTLENADRKIAGRFLIYHKTTGQHEIGCWDLVERDWRWRRTDQDTTFARKVDVAVRADTGEMACLSASGWLQIINLESGELLLNQKVEEKTRTGVSLHYADRYWLVVARNRDMKNWHRAGGGIQSMPLPESGELLDADLYCFPRDSEKATFWKQPREVESYCLVESELQNAPFIMLASRISATSRVQRNGDQCHLLVLDLRDGSVLVEKTVPMVYRLGLEADPESDTLTILAGAYTGTVHWGKWGDRPPRPRRSLKLLESPDLKKVLEEN